MADERVYPVHLYKHLHHPIYAHNKKVLDEKLLEGWTETRANIERQEFPKRLYNAQGQQKTAGRYVEGVLDLDAAQAEERELRKQGYSDKPVVAKEKIVAAGAAPDPKASARIDALENDVAELKEAQVESNAKLDQILSALTSGKKKD